MAKVPIQWRTWSSEAFDEARSCGRPVFLLVTAFWSEAAADAPAALCGDAVTGALLRESFVPILVDGERMPAVPLQYGLASFPSCAVLRSDGALMAGFGGADPHELREVLHSMSLAACLASPIRTVGLGAFCVPFVPPAGRDLERGLEKIEHIRQRVAQAMDPEAPDLPSLGGDLIQPLRFLLHYGASAGDKEAIQRAVSVLHAVGHSPLYDGVEGGFFMGMDGSRPRTQKLLRDNAQWLILALRAAQEPDGGFGLLLAKGILHYLQQHLLTPEGFFANSQREDRAYYPLNKEQRRFVAPPPVDPTAFAASNAMAVRSLCKGWRLLGERTYLEMALRTFAFIRDNLAAPDGTLAHYHAQSPGGVGHLDDLMEMGQAYLALYHSTLEPSYLDAVRMVARQMVVSFANPGGVGFLNMRLHHHAQRVPLMPVVDYELNARAAGFLILASAQLEEESLAAPAKAVLAALMEAQEPDLSGLSILGNALMSTLYPMPVFEAVTDGSSRQRFMVLERLRGMATSFSVVTHRLATPREGMQPLPRLVGHCGGQQRDIPLAGPTSGTG